MTVSRTQDAETVTADQMRTVQPIEIDDLKTFLKYGADLAVRMDPDRFQGPYLVRLLAALDDAR